MADDSFFNFPGSSKIDEMSIQEDDPEFDLLNEETFGHGISDDDDWEAQHEQLSHEYNKENKKEPIKQNYEGKEEEVDTNGISERMIQFVLSENEGRSESQSRQDNIMNMPFINLLEMRSFEERDTKFPDENGLGPYHWMASQQIPVSAPPISAPFPKILTLEEIERDLIKPNANKNGNVTTPAPQPPNPVLQKSSPPNLPMPGSQFNYNRLPPPPHTAPPPTFIQQRRPLNMMNMVQPMPGNFVVQPMQPSPHFPVPGAFMPPALQSQPKRFPNDFQRMDVRGGRQPGLEFHNRRQNRGRGGPHHYEPFSTGQRMYRPQQMSQNMVEDEYANLMTVQEKNWLAQIQQYQLNSMNPSRDDYYYTTYMNRKQGNSNRKNNFSGNQRLARETTPKAAYAPLQFENSLGKLQVGSVIAPRKIIDIDVVENVESSNQQVMPTTKQLLMEIEIMHNYVLQLEESDGTEVSSGLTPDSADKLVQHIIERARFNPYMNIHKGRQIVLRLLPFVSNTCPIMKKMVGSMVPVSKKNNGDSQLLLSYLPFIRSWLANIDLDQLIAIGTHVEPAIPHILTNKFAISVLANMVERAEHLMEVNGVLDLKWNNFITKVVKQTLERDSAEGGRNTALLERPVVGIDPVVLRRHLVRCTGSAFTPEQLTIALKTLSNAGPGSTPNS
ncbi:hypothetical protein LSTR_LSTR007609 [Laodelphax striatellus]|uniref:mRNA decay factor PAT1 domain-containing protein n=1 Tax=Laodelphax striatellus TaxID=195883 RepID=A0A482WIC5_LAOST|nr:hypothetical protein LSTR_LSTR007609 [Laodelphax striatellus]